MARARWAPTEGGRDVGRGPNYLHDQREKAKEEAKAQAYLSAPAVFQQRQAEVLAAQALAAASEQRDKAAYARASL
eukprot:11172048-Lingulodinium_polyedra.AAC.1